MPLFVDARIPVVFGDDPGPEDAVLALDLSSTVPHAVGCACCAARGPAAVALDALFQARVRGTVPWFNRVIAPEAAAGAVRDAVAADALTAARYRLG